MDADNGPHFVKNLAQFVRTHEKALANALQLQRRGSSQNATAIAAGASPNPSSISSPSSASSTIAAALSLPYWGFTSQNLKPVKLNLTPHHLFYLLSRFEELGILVGPMNIRLENIHNEVAPGNYVSFQGSAPKSRGRSSDGDSIHSVSSVRSVMSSMSSVWSTFTIGNTANKLEKQKALEEEDLKYLYSAFTKVPCLRLSPDPQSRLITGYEEFPFDTAVPLFAFKNVSALEICDLDFRQFFGWDRMSEQLRSLTIKRGSVDDFADLTIGIVLDDMDKRRKRSSKGPVPSSPAAMWPSASPSVKQSELSRSNSAPNSPLTDGRRASLGSPQALLISRTESSDGKKASVARSRQRSTSPIRPASSRHGSSYGYSSRSGHKFRRESGSSGSSIHSSTPRTSSSNLLTLGILPASKWRFLRHLSLSDNGLTFITAHSLAPLASTLLSLDLSSNLLTEIPESLATLTNLRALNLSNCMIDSLHSLVRNPLPAITTLNLRSNRLVSLAGIERLPSLETVDLRDNRLTDPTELARLTRMPEIRSVFVIKNPFVRPHPNYRVTIFNLFRSTPGYSEDILIDATGPSYGERRQLIERVLEPATPVLRLDHPATETRVVAEHKSRVHSGAQDGPSHAEGASSRQAADPTTASQRRRKTTRRRIVELSTSAASPASQAQTGVAAATTAVSQDDTRHTSSKRESRSPAHLRRLDTSVAHKAEEDTKGEQGEDDACLAQDEEEVGANSELYRQKIEALKSDLGSGWLTALSDDKWNEGKATTASREYSSNGTNTRTESRGVAVGGRSLG
ncbi:hypothetical protein AAFC00_001818 [Neodothiora populina]|uniref:Leucine rich repeat domain-containing protein n=1 Tax=Neodothiora populina TaxID=2781224 RepID=A0ABR3PQ76_9PEZI